MSSHQRTWVFSLCLLAAALLLVSGSVAATSAAHLPQSDLTAPGYAGQPRVTLLWRTLE